MSQTLGEIVSTALRQADAGIKVASLRDAPIADRGFARVDSWLAESLGQTQKVASQGSGGYDKTASAETEDPNSRYDDVRFGHKLAEALHYGVGVLEKLAGPLNKSDGGAPTPGPEGRSGPVAIQPGLYENAKTQTPRPQASAHARAAQANDTLVDGSPHNDADYMDNSGPVIPSGYPNSKTRTTNQSTKSASRHEVERLLNSKIAQHKMLVSLGQIDAAHAVAKEAADIAENASLIFGDDYGSANFPDNEGVRNMTKAQARDANTREAASFWGEPVKRDNAATTHLAVTHGLKLSSMKIADGVTGTTPVMPNVEPDQKLTKSREGKKTTKVAAAQPGLVRRVANRAKELVTGSRADMLGSKAVRMGTQVAKDTTKPGVNWHPRAKATKKIRHLAATERKKVLGTQLGLAGTAGVGLGAGGHALASGGNDGKQKKAAKKQESSGTLGAAIGAAALGRPGAAAGAGFTGRKENRGRRALGALGGSIAGTAAGEQVAKRVFSKAFNKMEQRANRVGSHFAGGNVSKAMRMMGTIGEGLGGYRAIRRVGSAAGAAAGNKLTDNYTKKAAYTKGESKDKSTWGKLKHEGTIRAGGAGLLPVGGTGALGAFTGGDKKTRGRRALGAAVGGFAGGNLAALAASRAGHLPTSIGASMIGKGLGAGLGNHLVHRLSTDDKK